MAIESCFSRNAWERPEAIAEVYGRAAEQGDDYGVRVLGCFLTCTINLVANPVR
jgi:hypothetical protein